MGNPSWVPVQPRERTSSTKGGFAAPRRGTDTSSPKQMLLRPRLVELPSYRALVATENMTQPPGGADGLGVKSRGCIL